MEPTLCLLNMLGLCLFWVKYAEVGLRRIYFTIFLSCYVFTYFGGILLADILYSTLGIAKISASDDTSWQLLALSECCLATFLTGYFTAAPVRKVFGKKRQLDWTNITNALILVLMTSFLIAMTLYVVGSGGPVLFKQGGYENRYDANVGMGGYSLFFSMGLLGCTFLSLKAQSRRQKRRALAITIGYCVMTFVVLGGYRQLGFAALFSLGVISLVRRDISFSRFIISFSSLIVITLAVAMLRYTGTTADETGGIAGRLFIFLYDGFAPVDAFYKIVEYCRFHSITANVIFNQFATPVPRAIWTTKPLIVMNAGNFYTQEILGRKDSITYSPTLLGELYLVGGSTACLIGTFASGCILRVFDEALLRSKNRMLVGFLFAFAFVFVFNLYREGISVLITKTILFGGAFVGLAFISKLLIVRPAKAAHFHQA